MIICEYHGRDWCRMYVQDCRHFGSWTLNSVQWTLPFSWNTFSLLLSFPCPRAISNIKFPLKSFLWISLKESPPYKSPSISFNLRPFGFHFLYNNLSLTEFSSNLSAMICLETIWMGEDWQPCTPWKEGHGGRGWSSDWKNFISLNPRWLSACF